MSGVAAPALSPRIAARRPARGRLRLRAAAARVDARPGRRLRVLPDLRLGARARRRDGRPAAAAARPEHPRAPSPPRCSGAATSQADGRIPTCASPTRPRARTKIESNPVRVGVGMGSWGGNFGGSVNVSSPSVRNYQEGTLVIHAIDVARNAEVWQGRISGRIGKGSLEPAAVTAAVAGRDAGLPGARPPISLPTGGNRRRASAACGTGACAPCRRASRAGRPCRRRAAAAACR